MQRIKLVWRNGADEKQFFDPENPRQLWDTMKEKLERYEYAIAQWYEGFYNEETGEQSEWDLYAELRGAMVREQ